MEVVRIMLKSRDQSPGQVTVADQLVEQLISRYANINRGKIMLIGVIVSSTLLTKSFTDLDPDIFRRSRNHPSGSGCGANWVVLYFLNNLNL